MYKSKLPADPTALIFGIIGLVIGIASCCCYGVLAIIPLGLSIAGLVMANKSLRLYRENPEVYEHSSYSGVNTAKIINIISVIINSIIFLLFLVFIFIYGTVFSTAILEGIRQGKMNDFETSEYDDYEWETDTTTIEAEQYIIEKEIDSVNIDSIINKN